MMQQRRLSNSHESPRHDVVEPGEPALDVEWPFGTLEGLDRSDFRQAAYEIFFTTCRSSPGFGGRGVATHYNSLEGGDGIGTGSGVGFNLGPSTKSSPGVGMAVTSRVKTALGLKMMKRSPSRRTSSMGGMPNTSPGGDSSPIAPIAFSSVPGPRARRPLTSAEIMRRQMRVTEQSDNRLRKTIMRTLVGQMGRRAETIILPLELLRNLKPSEFPTSQEYHIWQKRQLKILESGLLLNPSIPLEKSNPSAKLFREIIHASEEKAIDTGKSSQLMKSLCNSVVALAWRSCDGSQTDVCHWADGYPLNIHIYLALLYSIFDLKEETLVLDEVDELLELMTKTWNILGINKSIHNLCFSWVLFEQFIKTGQVEYDLIGASLAMLKEVSVDAKKVDREPLYGKMLRPVLISMKKWTEKRLADYHENFHRGTAISIENIVPFGFYVAKILEADVAVHTLCADYENKFADDSYGSKVDNYIRTSLQNAFSKMLEDAKVNGTHIEHEAGDVLIKLAKSTEELFLKERNIFSPTLKKWHPNAIGIAAVTLHNCYGTLLRQYLSESSSLTNDTILVLQRAGRLEKTLLDMVVEDSDYSDDGTKAIVKEMVPYEVNSLIMNLLRTWIQKRMKRGKEIVKRARETETWNPKSKNEPYAQTASELMKNAKDAIESFLDVPAGISEDLIHELCNGLEHIFIEYITFIASCGSKQSYLPSLPPLTRCSNESRFTKLLRKAKRGVRGQRSNLLNEGNHPRPSTSRGTHRLYIRLNTLHYLLIQLHSIDKTIVVSPRENHLKGSRRSRKINTSSYFDHTRQAIQVSLQHVAEVASYRSIFLDANSVFYGSLYVQHVNNARIPPALRMIKQNLSLLCSIVADKAQPLALKEVMKASFEAYLMVLLAGGCSRAFTRADHQVIEEDFKSLKRIFCTGGEGLISEDSVDVEAETVEGVIALMEQTTEHLVEDFSIVACEASGIGMAGEGQKLPMPPTTGRWNKSDANTILRVLCHRNDRPANTFLKRTFQLPKRRC